MDVFDWAVKEIITEEGGYNNDPNDSGGATNYGITLLTLRQWRNDSGVSANDVQNLTEDEAIKIYKSLYWDKVHGDDMRPAIAILMFDTAVNQGVTTAIRFAQHVMEIAEDGIIGPQTMKSFARVDPTEFSVNFMALRATRYAALPGWNNYGLGWMRRLFNIIINTNNFVNNN